MSTASGKPTVCVVNFNGRNALPPTLEAACALREHFAGIILLDNGSSDDSVAYVEREFPEVQILKLGSNRGAGGARNAGLRQSPTDRILFIDNDVALTAECVERLDAALDGNPAAALAAATVIYAHKRDTIQYDGAECHFLGIQRLLDEDQPVSAVPPAVRKVGSLSTCCFMADRRRIPPGEYFDETYFYIFEDHDYGVRLRLLGAEILSVTNAPCYHGKGTAGLSIRQLGSYSSKRIHYTIRNRWLMLLKNFQLHTLLILMPIFMVYELAQFLLIVKKGWLQEWWQAVRWIVANFPMILRERRRIQTARRVPDRAVLIGGAAPFRAELTAGAFERCARRALDVMLGGYWKVASVLI